MGFMDALVVLRQCNSLDHWQQMTRIVLCHIIQKFGPLYSSHDYNVRELLLISIAPTDILIRNAKAFPTVWSWGTQITF